MAAMTIGPLSRRTGIPVKALRTYEDMGLIYTVGRLAPGPRQQRDRVRRRQRFEGVRARGRVTN
jgi:MerR family transcriptional regulator, copper efflux regulator